MRRSLLIILSILMVSLLSCEKEESNNTQETCSDGIQNQGETGVDCGGPCPACSVPITSEYYFTGTIDGKEVTIQNGKSFYGIATGTGSFPEDNGGVFTCFISYKSGISNYDDVNSLYVDFQRYYAGGCSASEEDDQFHDLFTVGSHTYASSASNKGIVIQWVDSDGDYWKTDYGSQGGSSFTLISEEETDAYVNLERHKVKANFTCTVYNISGNESKVIENGEIVIYLQEYQ